MFVCSLRSYRVVLRLKQFQNTAKTHMRKENRCEWNKNMYSKLFTTFQNVTFRFATCSSEQRNANWRRRTQIQIDRIALHQIVYNIYVAIRRRLYVKCFRIHALHVRWCVCVLPFALLRLAVYNSIILSFLKCTNPCSLKSSPYLGIKILL